MKQLAKSMFGHSFNREFNSLIFCKKSNFLTGNLTALYSLLKPNFK